RTRDGRNLTCSRTSSRHASGCGLRRWLSLARCRAGASPRGTSAGSTCQSCRRPPSVRGWSTWRLSPTVTAGGRSCSEGMRPPRWCARSWSPGRRARDWSICTAIRRAGSRAGTSPARSRVDTPSGAPRRAPASLDTYGGRQAMYGHVSAPTRVYRYGARTPHEGLDALRSQEREAHRLRSALIEIERDRRAAAEAAILEHAPDVAAALARVAEIDAAIEIEREAMQHLLLRCGYTVAL